MIPYVLAVGTAIGIGWWLGRHKWNAAAKKAIMNKIQAGTATATDLRDAANKAGNAGDTDTSQALHEKADVQQAIEENETTLPSIIPSPFTEASDAQWDKLVSLLMPGRFDGISSDYQLGAFLIDMRQLADYGYAGTAKQVDYNGRKVYQGEWKAPYSLQGFLSNAQLQYEVFEKVMKGHYTAITNRYPLLENKGIKGSDGREVYMTLSGALALCRRLGLGGFDKVFQSGDISTLPTDAVQTFGASNGLF